MKKQFVIIMIVACLLLRMMTLLPAAAGMQAEGTCGENLKWTLTNDGVLTVSGSGAMTDYEFFPSQHLSPWSNVNSRGLINTVVIEDGVTHIGTFAFTLCDNLKTIVIGKDITNIGKQAFTSCPAVERIYWNVKSMNDFEDNMEPCFNVGGEFRRD